jgi:hypothetical protein
LSLFIDYHAKNLVPEIPSFLQDTPNLSRLFKNRNKTSLSHGSFPMSKDMAGLCSNIPLKRELIALRKPLIKERTKPY